MITPKQLKAARALLGWDQDVLAGKANLATSTVADFESGKRKPVFSSMAAMVTAVDGAGLAFWCGGVVFREKLQEELVHAAKLM